MSPHSNHTMALKLVTNDKRLTTTGVDLEPVYNGFQ